MEVDGDEVEVDVEGGLRGRVGYVGLTTRRVVLELDTDTEEVGGETSEYSLC